jgi:hypothetical protein
VIIKRLKRDFISDYLFPADDCCRNAGILIEKDVLIAVSMTEPVTI